MTSYHVILTGHAPGAAGLSLLNETREFVVHDVGSPGEAELHALRVAREAGVEGARVVTTVPWIKGPVVYPSMGGPRQ